MSASAARTLCGHHAASPLMNASTSEARYRTVFPIRTGVSVPLRAHRYTVEVATRNRALTSRAVSSSGVSVGTTAFLVDSD